MIVAAIILLSAFAVITAFVFVFSVQRLLQDDVWCPWYIKVIAYIWLAIGLPADVLFNWIWGTVIFREFPRELMFTARVKRHMSSSGENRWKAERWASMLNAVDPGHV